MDWHLPDLGLHNDLAVAVSLQLGAVAVYCCLNMPHLHCWQLVEHGGDLLLDELRLRYYGTSP